VEYHREMTRFPNPPALRQIAQGSTHLERMQHE
jgi:hypothetical protein